MWDGLWGELSECLHLEQYLLDCLADLQRADDEGRRKRAINKSETWDLLNKIGKL